MLLVLFCIDSPYIRDVLGIPDQNNSRSKRGEEGKGLGKVSGSSLVQQALRARLEPTGSRDHGLIHPGQ